eukprot:10415588-Alexandrium_andersonii.AAC.1
MGPFDYATPAYIEAPWEVKRQITRQVYDQDWQKPPAKFIFKGHETGWAKQERKERTFAGDH